MKDDFEDWNKAADERQRKWAEWQMYAKTPTHDWFTYFFFWHPVETTIVITGLAALAFVIWLLAQFVGPPIPLIR